MRLQLIVIAKNFQKQNNEIELLLNDFGRQIASWLKFKVTNFHGTKLQGLKVKCE